MDDLQYIYGKQRELDETKEVKMRLPVGHLIRLHSLKLLSGQNLSDTVAKALTVYFERMDADKKLARAAREQEEGEGVVDPSV